jgi:hypothetical protein
MGFSALAEAELPVVCVETRHMQAVLKAQINKTDRNDARGIAQRTFAEAAKWAFPFKKTEDLAYEPGPPVPTLITPEI